MMWAIVALIGCRVLGIGAPHLEVRGPVGPVRAMAEFTIRVSSPDSVVRRLLVTVDGERSEIVPLPDGPQPYELGWVLGVRSLSHGPHEVVFRAYNDGFVAAPAVAPVRVEVDRVPPELELHAPSLVVGQGRTVAVWVRGDEPLTEGTLRIEGDREPMFAVDGVLRALRGIPISATPGPTSFMIQAEDRAGNSASIRGELVVEPTQFEEGGFIKLTPSQVSARKDAAANTQMRAERDEAYALRTLEQRWEGPFRTPVIDGRRTSSFGRLRTYSDGRRDHHTGMDLAKAEGVEVLAAAAGRVVLAKEQPVFGNVVILDHGHGVTTSYNHLASIAVEAGQMVELGQVVATMGSTGQSTAPHLHYGMVVGDFAVDPGQWFAEDFSTPPFGPAERRPQ